MFTNIKEQLKLELKSLFDISPDLIPNKIKFQSVANRDLLFQIVFSFYLQLILDPANGHLRLIRQLFFIWDNICVTGKIF